MRGLNGVHVLRTGLTTSAVTVPYDAGDEILAISFKASVFMPLMPGPTMRDRGVLMPTANARRFWLGNERLEIPTIESAVDFVNALARGGFLRTNDTVERLLFDEPMAMSERTMQRHFFATTGITHKQFTQIQRAQRAASLLRAGESAGDVVHALGYADQPHMSRSLKTIMGQTPTEIVFPDRSWFDLP